MADKSNTVSKKTIIAIVTVIVLLFIAGLSVGIFLADKGSTEAVDGNQSSSETQTAEENKANDVQKSDENKAEENKTTEDNNQNVADNAETTNNNENVADDTTTTNNNGNAADNTAANNSENVADNTATTNNNGNAINNPAANNNAENVTTNTDVNQVGETTITRVEEQEKLVSRDFWDWWTPSSVIAGNSAVADKIIPQTPDFTVEKTATTGVSEDKLVYANKNITYTIKVTNNGEQELKNIEITDKIPEQTTFVSIDDAQNSGTTILENDTVIGLKWIVTVPAKESIEVKFTVKVNENATGTISNAAIVNGKESNEEKTSIINAKKSSKIIERNNIEVKDGLEVAKLGDKIKYTITATNTGDISGKTTIEDTVPVGTELIESSVTDAGKITTTTDNRKQISWNVELGANETIERTFIVEVKDISGKIENVATVGGVPTNPDKIDTADIKVLKEVADIKRDKESIGKDKKVQAGDAIEYKITVTNTGSVDLTNVILEEKLEYVTIEALTINGEIKTIAKNNDGKLIIGDLKAGTDKKEADKAEITVRYIVNYEKDVQGNVEKLIHNEAVATGETIPTDPDKTPETVTDKDEKDVPVDEVKSLTISKTATKIKVKDSAEFVDAQNVKVRPGDIVEYTIIITNTGNTTLENITVTDSLKVTVNGKEKTVDPSTGVSTIAVIPSLSAVSGENTTTIFTYYTVTKEDTVDANPIKNVAKATVPDGPTEESHEEVPVNPDTSVSVKKVWNDNENQDGIRPEKITISLWADDKKVDTATISGTEYTFTRLPKYKADGSGEIVYTVAEDDVPDYTIESITGTAENGYVITNKHEVEKTKVAVVKKWKDSNNQDGIRPTSIIVKLMNGTIEVARETLSEANNWTYTFKDLDKKAKGENIDYTIEEINVSGYTSAISGNIENGYKITNTHQVEKKNIKVSKAWNDANNQDGIRPRVINVRLKADGEIVPGKKVTLNESNKWNAEFTGLDKNKNGKEIQYTVEEEEDVPGYTPVISGDAKNGYVIKNSHTPEVTSVKVQKVWEDVSNQDGIRPDSITVRLKANGTEVADKVLTLNDTNQWSGTFEELPKKAKGQKINYTVVEDAVKGYTTSIIGNAKQEYIIVNTHEVEKTSIEVSKAWEDDGNRDGIRPENVVINLVANDVVLDKKSVILNEKNNWSAKFDGLDKKANGKDIRYSVVENNVPKGYEVSSIDIQNSNKFIVTNKHTTDVTSITIRKSWDDANNQDGIRPTSIHAKLIADGIVKETVELNEANNWQHQFTNLPVNKDGEHITYTIDEVEDITGYTKHIEGTTIQNTHTPEVINIPVSKVWEDKDDQDGKRPTKVDVVLKANNQIVDGMELNAENNWNGVFANKPKNANGKEIKYTIQEINVKDYDSVVSGDVANGYKITNTHEVEKTSVRVSKDWNDGGNQDGIRPSSIIVRLEANGTEVATKILDASNQWAGTFEELDKKANGKNIKYTIKEDSVDGYATEITGNAKNGYLITNTHKPEITSVKVNKIWDDANNQDGKRPTEVTITLKGNNKFIQTIELNNKNEWTHTFKNLPKKAGGKDIEYTVEEDNIENGYKSNITKKAESGYEYDITNSYTPEKVSINVTKEWDDNNNQDGIRPENVVIDLYADNTIVEGNTITLSEANGWNTTISNLPKYKSGKEIQYTFRENEVKGYKYSITGSIEQGVVIKNTHTPETLDIPVSKKWENIDNDAARNEYLISSIILQVKNGDKVVAEKTVGEKAVESKDIAGNWKWTFKGLPKYEAGKLINYTVAEKAVNEEEQVKLDNYYKANINQETKIITNKFDPSNLPDTKTVVLTKIWDDSSNKYRTRPSSVEFTVDGKNYTLTSENDENVKENSTDIWTITTNLPKYDVNGNEISYNATEKTVPTGYEKVSEEGLTVTNRANELINKTAYKADANGNIGSPATNKDTFAANETVYYKITLKNAGSEPISKTVTDEIPLRLTLNTVDGKTGESGTTDKGDDWTVTKNDKEQSVVTWEVKDLAAGKTRELIIKATVVAEAEYKDICNKTIDGTTAYTAKLFVRKDGKVPYESSGTGYDASLYTGELGTVYLNSSDLHYDTNANLKNDDLYYLIKNNNIITDMVAKGITRTQLVDALKTNGTTLADDEVVVWYVIKNESDGYHIDGVIRKISSLTEITNTAFTDKVSSDSTIKLEDIEIGQRGSITVKSITSSTDTVSTPMDVVFVLDTSGSMTYPLEGKNETAVENSRAKAMVNAVNSSIKTIMSKNKESRVGVVGFSGDASTIIPLGNYAQNIDYLTREYSAGGWMYDSSQTIKSNVGNKLSRQVTGGTNTQSGIKLGAEMLISNQNTTTATVTLKDGTTKTITRTPLLILVTDGEPTYYYGNATATGKVNGYGYADETDEDYYYWTLRTAKYYKDQITNKYYQNTDKTAKVFTIGIGLKGNEAVAMLDPTTEKVNACNNNNWQQKALYNLITDNGKIVPGAYSYADGSKTGEITESDLTNFLNTSIDSSVENEESRAITVEESKARRVELGNINTSKEFKLKIGEKTYSSISSAQNAGYLKKDSKGYYIDLTKVERSTDVNITYWNN